MHGAEKNNENNTGVEHEQIENDHLTNDCSHTPQKFNIDTKKNGQNI